MRSFISVLAVAGAAAQFAAAQSPDSLLGCAMSVLSSIELPNCDASDISCLCSNAPFLIAVKTAIGQQCSPSDQTKAISFAESLCNQVPSLARSHPMIPSGRRVYASGDGECTCAYGSGFGSPSPSGFSPESTPSGSTPSGPTPCGSTSALTPGAAVPAGSPAPSGTSGTTSSSSSAAVPPPSINVPATKAPSSSATTTSARTTSARTTSATTTSASPVQGSQSASPSSATFEGGAAQSLPGLVVPLTIWIFAAFAVM